MRRLMIFSVMCLICSGCSGQILRCGFDGDSGYVELVNNVPVNASQVRTYSELCGFIYDGESE